MIYELITPTDPYTFEAPTKEIAALVVFLLSTFYAAETDDESNEYDIPVLYFLDPDEWYKDEFGHSASDGLIQNQAAVKDALLSFVYGYHLDRETYFEKYNALQTEEEKFNFRNTWNGNKIGQMDIAEYAEKVIVPQIDALIERVNAGKHAEEAGS